AEMATRHGRRDEAESLLVRALAIDDRDLDAHRMLGRLRWDVARRDEAFAHFERVVQLDPTELPLRVLVGQHQLERGEPASALAPLTEAAALAPDDADVRHLLELAWLRHGNRQAREREFDKALTSYEEALRIEPGNVEARTNRVRVLAHVRRLDESGNAANPRSE
ncbi:MAG TPA: tetratricopeptide repeat protein, partial [Opitutus sp.]|nr:tetratricopeptide repeat protein [Opitutus sp.]